MRLQELHIKNFKSLVDLKISEPNPFTVFAGANRVGKSNIFEALEFNAIPKSDSALFQRLFGSKEDLTSRILSSNLIEISLTVDPVGTFTTYYNFGDKPAAGIKLGQDHDFHNNEHNSINNLWYSSFSRLFIGNKKELKYPFKDDFRLALDASNLVKLMENK